MRIEIDDNGDVTGYYDILNWQLDDNGEVTFVELENIYSQTLNLNLWWLRMQQYFGTLNHQRLVILIFYFVYI